MQYKMIVLIGVVLGTSAGVAESVKLDQKTLETIEKNTKILQLPNLQVQEGIEKEGYYFLKVGLKTQRGIQIHNTFVDKQSGMVYVGEAYDKEGKPVRYPIDKKVVREGVSFRYGEGKKDLYVVTDPECPYCSKFEREALGKLDAYTVHVIFYPLPFHKKAPAMIEWIMQGRDGKAKKERMDAVMLHGSKTYETGIKEAKQSFRYSPAIKEAMAKAKLAIQVLEAQGTPTVYDENFSMVPWKQLVK